MNNVILKYNGSVYKDETTITLENTRTVLLLEIGVNDSYDNNCFDIEYDCQWITYNRMRNIVELIIAPTYISRETIVVFSNKANSDIRFELTIHQNGADCSILISEDTVEYKDNIIVNAKDLLSKTDSDEDKHIILLKYTNGRPYISSVKEYAMIYNDSEDFVKVKYDNGLNLNLKDKQLEIVNFGKSNLYYNHYYIITIKNKQDIGEEATITVKYNIAADNFSIQ